MCPPPGILKLNFDGSFVGKVGQRYSGMLLDSNGLLAVFLERLMFRF